MLPMHDVDALLADDRPQRLRQLARQALVLEVVAHERDTGCPRAELVHGKPVVVAGREVQAGWLAGPRPHDDDRVAARP